MADGTILEAFEGRVAGVKMHIFFEKQRTAEHLESFIQSYMDTWYDSLNCVESFTLDDVNQTYREFLGELAAVKPEDLLDGLSYLELFYPRVMLEYYEVFMLQALYTIYP